jgi:glutamate synthase domain-containing protein 2
MWIVLAFLIVLAGVAAYDVTQRKHTILRNFPIIGHFRYWLEAVGPELRQYIVTDNDEERPFSRDQRSWVYASAKRDNTYFGFGSDNDMELASNYLIVQHSPFPLADLHPGQPGFDPGFPLPCPKVLGGARGRAKAFRPASAVNVSAMSYGALSSAAVEAVNGGCRIAGCMQNTGEGGVSRFHLGGADLVWQIGTGYFGCRDQDGRFSFPRLVETVARHPQIKAIEIKLSQGAKPGVGGFLPAAKVSAEIAAARGIPIGRDCVSPPAHSAFGSVDEMLDLVERIATETGLPVGIKSAVGQMAFWRELAELMATTERGVDYVVVDGGEGGTGAGPLVFVDHVALPFAVGFSRVYRTLAKQGMHEKVVLVGSGRLGFPERALFGFALGCDMINIAREAMMAIGCIQAQRCHTDRCPTGIATHHPWLVRGLLPERKAVRLANHVITLRRELLRLSHACGVVHPALVTAERLEILDGRFGSTTAAKLFDYFEGLGLPSRRDREEIERIMRMPAGEHDGTAAS